MPDIKTFVKKSLNFTIIVQLMLGVGAVVAGSIMIGNWNRYLPTTADLKLEQLFTGHDSTVPSSTINLMRYVMTSEADDMYSAVLMYSCIACLYMVFAVVGLLGVHRENSSYLMVYLIWSVFSLCMMIAACSIVYTNSRHFKSYASTVILAQVGCYHGEEQCKHFMDSIQAKFQCCSIVDNSLSLTQIKNPGVQSSKQPDDGNESRLGKPSRRPDVELPVEEPPTDVEGGPEDGEPSSEKPDDDGDGAEMGRPIDGPPADVEVGPEAEEKQRRRSRAAVSRRQQHSKVRHGTGKISPFPESCCDKSKKGNCTELYEMYDSPCHASVTEWFESVITVIFAIGIAFSLVQVIGIALVY